MQSETQKQKESHLNSPGASYYAPGHEKNNPNVKPMKKDNLVPRLCSRTFNFEVGNERYHYQIEIVICRWAASTSFSCRHDQLASIVGAVAGSSCKATFQIQNVPSATRVAAGDFGFLTLIQVFDGPDLYTDVSRFDTMP